jgi:hypothetical protein
MTAPTEDLNTLERAVQAGDSGAAARLGLRLLMGTDAPPDPGRGLGLIEQAARDGDADGAYLAATVSSSSFWHAQSWDRAFDYLLQAAGKGHEAAQSSLQILAGGPAGADVAGATSADMRGMINLTDWLTPPEAQLVRETPRIQVIEKFAPPAACDWLIAQSREQQSRATIYDQATGGTTEDGRRTNSQCDLDVRNCGVLTFVLRARIAAVTGRPDQAMEVPKVLHYSPGETFARHFDYLNPAEPAYATELAVRGQRTETFLIYLNDDYEGGETHFNRLDISNRGATGDALLFSNVDASGAPDEDTMHTGMPPTSGEKWLFSQWIREFPK